MSAIMGRPRLEYRHGNSAGYNHDHCRCEECRAYNRSRPSLRAAASPTPAPSSLDVVKSLLLKVTHDLPVAWTVTQRSAWLGLMQSAVDYAIPVFTLDLNKPAGPPLPDDERAVPERGGE